VRAHKGGQVQKMVDQAEIHRKVVSGDVEERRWAVKLLRSNFADLPDKDVAWEDLHRLTWDEDSSVRDSAAVALGFAFQYVSDKDGAWNDLIRLIENEDIGVRTGAAVALGRAFQHVPDTKQAWNDLIRLIENEYSGVRMGAAFALGPAFQHVHDKKQAWNDLHRLTEDEDSHVLAGAASSLGFVFQHVPDTKQAWSDLHRLTEDEDIGVRTGAAYALSRAFQHVHDKKQAWNDLHRLTEDEDSHVRAGAVFAIGPAFQHVHDKKQAWNDLHRLTEDENSDVRMSANHSLGRASIFKATEEESKDYFESELNNAIKFFERSSKEATSSNNPSSFCLPFYRSFYTITFEKARAKGEVEKYLAEAKSASEGSENKEILLEAIENLASALTEAHKATDFDAMKSDLNVCRRYCDRAADLIRDVEGETPGAAGILRRGLPIIDQRIKELIREVQEKAGVVCRETRGTGTPYEPLGMEVNKWAGELLDRDYLRNEKNVFRIVQILGEFCDLLPEDKRKYPCKIVEEIREESELEDKLSSIATAFSYMQPCIESQLQNAAKPTTDKMRSDGQPSQKTDHSTTVFAGAGSTVVVPHTETESGDVTVTTNAKATKELQPEEHRTDHRKKTAIEIIAAIAVSVLVGIVSSRYLEDLTPTSSTVIAFIAFIILLIIILMQNRDKSS